MEYKIVVDSGCELTEEMKKSNMFGVAPLTLQLEDKAYIDDDKLDVKQYLLDMKNCKSYAKTAAPSPESFIQKSDGAESVFFVTLSSELSGAYNAANIAKNMILEEAGKRFVHVFDSMSASIGETLIARRISELLLDGLRDTDVVGQVTKYINELKTLFVLDRFDNLAKNGRVNAAIAKLSGILSIKLICRANKGVIEMTDKAFGWKKAVIRMIDIIARECDDHEDRVFGITHVNCYERAVQFKDELLKRIQFKEIIITEAAGLCSTYAEQGGLIVAY